MGKVGQVVQLVGGVGRVTERRQWMWGLGDLVLVADDERAPLRPQHERPPPRPPGDCPDARSGEQAVQQLGVQKHHLDQIEWARTEVEIDVGQRARGRHDDVSLPVQVIVQALAGQHALVQVAPACGEHPAQARRKSTLQAPQLLQQVACLFCRVCVTGRLLVHRKPIPNLSDDVFSQAPPVAPAKGDGL